MVAIFTGVGAGFQRGSATALGSAGLLGSSGLGRGGESVSLNAATGNLVVSRQDEFLIGRGPDIGISRTYNSLGAVDDNGDYWRQSTDRRVIDFVGPLNGWGSSVKRVSADGSVVTYSWQGSYYQATDGAGAHDLLSYNGSTNQWTWTDGDSRMSEVYGEFGPNDCRIISQRDADGNTLTFSYSGNKVTRITTQDGAYTDYSWSGNNITAITTTWAGGSFTKTTYGYDGQNRLTSVTTGGMYTTYYAYHGSSNLVSAIWQTDGSRIDVSYDGASRVNQIVQTVAGGDYRTTNIAYGSGYTQITDPRGQTTTLYYDGAGQLTQITAPPAYSGAAAQTVSFLYDGSGNVTRVTNAGGGQTNYVYDASGNVTRVTDPNGNYRDREYDANNSLTREIFQGSYSAEWSGWLYSRNVYDAENHLRYAISADGHVTEYRYTNEGELQVRLEYSQYTYAVGGSVPSLAAMNAWRDGLGDRSLTKNYEYRYDARGNVAETVAWNYSTYYGDAAASDGYSHDLYSYDSAGRVLSHYSSGWYGDTFVYDALGRVTASTDINGGTTTFVFNDAATTTTVTTAAGYTTVSTYNKAGDLISQTDSGASVAGGTNTYLYDKNGQLRRMTDAAGYNHYYVYDKAGRKIADVGHWGETTEYRYDQTGRLTATARYTNAPPGSISQLNDPNSEIDLASIRPAVHGWDVWQWTVYDAGGRVIETISGNGSVNRYEYDQSDRLIATYGYANKLSAGQVQSFMAAAPTSLVLPGADSHDTITRTFYDRDGRVIGALNAEGYLSQIIYDGAGRKIQEIAYANATYAGMRLTGTFDSLWNSFAHDANRDISTRYIYDNQGNLRWTVDALNRVTEYFYWDGAALNYAVGLVWKTVTYAAPLSALGAYDRNTMTNAVAALQGNSANRISYNVYNSRRQLTYTVDASNAIVGFTYDVMGRVTKATQFAATVNMGAMGPEWQWSNNLDAWAAGNLANARISRRYYAARGDVRYTVDAEGYATQYDYHATGKVYREYRYANKLAVNDGWSIDTVYGADKGGFVYSEFHYDDFGRNYLSIDPNGVQRLTAYFYNGQQAWDVRDYQGNYETGVWRYFVYDQGGRLTNEYTYLNELWGASEAKAYVYDGLGNLAASIDPNGRTTNYTYDKVGRVLTSTDALGGVTSYEYDAFGRGVKVTDARGFASYSYFDRAGRVTLAIDAEGYATQTAYTAFGEIAAVTRMYSRTSGASVGSPPGLAGHSLDATTTFQYDKLSRLVQTTDAEGAYEQYTLNAFGQQTAVRNKLGGWTYNYFDKRGLLTHEYLPVASYNSSGGQQASSVLNYYEYDSRGNRTRMYEAWGLAEQRVTTYEYDAGDRLIRKWGEAVGATNVAEGYTDTITPTDYFYYDHRGNLIEKRDTAGARTLFWYDKLDRVTHTLVQTTDGYGRLTRNIYDSNGNITETRAYASLVGLPGSAAGSPPGEPGSYRVVQFAYDALNRMTQSKTPNVFIGVYNGSFWAGNQDLVTSYEYDAMGNVTKVTDPNGRSAFSYYDKLGRKTIQIDQENYRTDYLYLSDGNVLQERRWATRLTSTPNTGWAPDPVSSMDDRITDMNYDRMGRRTVEVRYNVLVHDGSGNQTGAASAVYYAYNGLGEITRKTESTGEYIDYAYDYGGRMTSEQRYGFADVNGVWVNPGVDYYYDGLNNMARSRARGAANANERVTTYGYRADGKILWKTDAEGFGRTYRYDAAGRVTREEYNRLTPGGWLEEAVGYAYDAEGRVTRTGIMNRSGSAWTRAGLDTVTTHYNAFGEVSERGLNDVYAEKFEYDGAGRVWRSTAGDGLPKYFMYDRAGNQTVTISSAWADLENYSMAGLLATYWGASSGNIALMNFVNGAVAMISRYDGRGQAVEVIEPQRQINASTTTNLSTSRGYNAFGEVSYEINAGGHRIDYAYNTMGRLIRTESPTVLATYENGGQAWLRPTEHRYYDVSGRLVASRDANGNLTRMSLLAGTGYGGTEALVRTITSADGGTVTSYYDIHGDARAVSDQIGRMTWQGFDRLGRLTSSSRPGGLVEYYEYDGLGQRIRRYNSFFGSGVQETTTYDAQGRVTQQVAMGGDVTTHSYGWGGGIGTSGLGVFGAWAHTTTMANGRSTTEYTDQFGHSVSKYDLSGRYTGYHYDRAGRLSQLIGGETLFYSYYNTGRVSSTFTMTGTVESQNWTRNRALYGYDALGNLTSEYQAYENEQSYWTSGWYEWVPDTSGGGYNVWHEPEYVYSYTNAVYENATATYDGLGRLTSWNEAGSGMTPPASISYAYDAAGNIRHTYAVFRTLDAFGNASGYANGKDMWYRYDAMNRVVTTEGELVNGQIVRGTNGTDIFYDLAGQRAFTLTSFSDVYYTYDYVWDYYYQDYIYTQVPNSFINVRREDFTYDAAGRLDWVRANQGYYDEYSQTAVAPTGPGTTRALYDFDQLGRLTGQWDYEANGSTIAYQRWTSFNEKGQITVDNMVNRRGGTTYQTSSYYDYGWGSDYALGSPVSITTYNWQNGTQQQTNSTVNSYQWWDGPVQTSIVYKPDINQSTSYTSSYVYQHVGGQARLQAVGIGDGRSRTVSFTNNIQGQALRRDENDAIGANGDPHEVWYRYGGRQMGYVGNNGTTKTDYVTSINDREATTGNGAFRNGSAYGASAADFDQGVSPINSYSQGSSASSYTVRNGESLSSIAASLWGDSSLWYKLAEANGLSGQATLIAGQSLNVPQGVYKVHHNASTFSPYDPGEIIGDTGPTTPVQPKPKKNKCGGFGTILLVVIAVVVTIYTAGAAAGGFAALANGGSFLAGAGAGFGAVSSFGIAGAAAAGAATTAAVAGGAAAVGIGTAVVIGGAVGGALGSIASQVVGVATGIQEKFSWNAVGIAAIGGALGGSKLGIGGKGWGAMAARSMTSSMISQGIGVVTGMQKQFSWAGVAAAGAASAVTTILGGDLAPLYGEGQSVSLENIAAHMAVSAAASVASAATLSLIDGSDFGDNMISALPDIIGASLGEAIVGLTGACFVAGTLVHTPKGLTKIEDIKAGDWVFSRDEHFENHDLHRKQVVDVFRFDQKATLNVTVTNAHGREVLVRATPEHPFAVEGGKWISARELRPGDHLIDIEGRRCTVARVSPADGLTTVHNIAVEHDHTYFVSENGIWVHNRYGRIDWEARAKAQREGRYAPELELEDYEYDEWATYAVFETDRGERQVEYYYPDAGKDLEAFIRAFDPSYDFSPPPTIGPIRHVVDFGPNSVGNLKYTDLYVSQLADHAANLYDMASRRVCLNAPPLYERTYLRGQELNLVTSSGQRASAILVPQSATSLGTISNARVLVQPSSAANGLGGSTASRIGTSGYANWQEFAEALHGVYQRATDRAYSAWMAMTPDQQRATSNRHPNAQMGSYIDEAARADARSFVRGQGLLEGPGQDVRIGRRMYNSTGTRYVMPDIFVPRANYIVDGSVSNKTLSMNNNQIANMLRYSGAPQMALVRPTQLGGGYNIPLIGPQFTGRTPARLPPPAIMPNNARRAPTRVR